MNRPSHPQTGALQLRLSAFAFADVAGYSRLMEADQVGTVRDWARVRDTVLDPKLREHHGRLVSGAGDAILAEFPSATDAVAWALDVQRAIAETPETGHNVQVRIGINVDDVVDDGATLQSEGVIIAARIHQLASPGEVVVTRLARDIVANRLSVFFRDRGWPQLKNIDRPVQVFAVEEMSEEPDIVRPHANWESKPTLAVLPFRDENAPESERYFGEGITENIINGVSRSRAMFVVARTSALHFAGRTTPAKEIAAALGVKYLLSGTVHRQKDKLRISTELVDVDRNRAVWAEKFTGDRGDLFEFQDRIAASIIATLEPKVLSAEAANLGNRSTSSLDAYDCVLRALSLLYQFRNTSYAQAMSLLERAVQLDPGYAQAHAYLAWCLNFWVAEGHSSDLAADKARGIHHAARAVELDPEDAMVLSIRAHVMSFQELRVREGLSLLDEALRLNENLPLAWCLSATSQAYLGNGEEARELMKNVWRLTPYDPLNFFFWTAAGLAEFVAGQYDSAIQWLQKSRRAKPNFRADLRLLAASLALSGRTDEARRMGAELLDADPAFSISAFMSWYPLEVEEARDRLALGLAQANLPE